jgi:monofunctional biosynthetic peptidoglycan transglycosylase
MGKTLKAIINKLTKLKMFLLKVVMLFFQASVFFIIIYRIVPVPVTPLQITRLFDQMAADKSLRLKKDWEPIDDLGKNICKAAITSEDIQFFNHYGFDFEQIWESFKAWFKYGKKLRGASTISQQTAKNLFFTPKRSWLRKVLEAYVTASIEILWTKKRILEVYLNIIEMGDGIYGAEAAAQFYFGKPAADLTKHEAALIVACFPNPIKWSPAKPTPFIKKKQAVIVKYMNRAAKLPWDSK